MENWEKKTRAILLIADTLNAVPLRDIAEQLNFMADEKDRVQEESENELKIPLHYGTPDDRNTGANHRVAFWAGYDGILPAWLELNGSAAHKAWIEGRTFAGGERK